MRLRRCFSNGLLTEILKISMRNDGLRGGIIDDRARPQTNVVCQTRER